MNVMSGSWLHRQPPVIFLIAVPLNKEWMFVGISRDRIRTHDPIGRVSGIGC
jgi:hypothetical protein